MAGYNPIKQPAASSTADLYGQQPVYPTGGLTDYTHSADDYGAPVVEKSPAAGSKWNPRAWRKRTWAILAGVVVVIIIAVVVGAVEGAKANRYPNYTPLAYTPQDSYAGNSFFDQFSYYNNNDPAEGYVIYDNPIDAHNRNITGVNSYGHAYLQLNTTSPAENNQVFAHSARVVSNKTYDSGLFLFDVYHTPIGCAVWPAVWLLGSDPWPANGEIDVIEATNQGARGVQTTLHTSDNCDMNVKRQMTGTALQSDCHNTTNANAGCGVQGPVSSYGAAFNKARGGAYALEWRSEGIRMWFWPRDQLPADVSGALDTSTVGSMRLAAAPDPSTWGTAMADFPGTDCNIGSHFRNMSIIANIDTCGQYAGKQAIYKDQDQCPGTDCVSYVQQNPGAFGEAYWEFGAFQVYRSVGPKT